MCRQWIVIPVFACLMHGFSCLTCGAMWLCNQLLSEQQVSAYFDMLSAHIAMHDVLCVLLNAPPLPGTWVSQKLSTRLAHRSAIRS